MYVMKASPSFNSMCRVLQSISALGAQSRYGFGFAPCVCLIPSSVGAWLAAFAGRGRSGLVILRHRVRRAVLK